MSQPLGVGRPATAHVRRRIDDQHGCQTDAMVTREWGRPKIRYRSVIVESLPSAIGNLAGG
jgi:hypothetical protein